jgi:ferredoxin
MLLSDLQQALWGSGLIIRGGFHATAEDGIPIDDGPVCTVVLVGNVGEALWRAFSRSPEYSAGEAQSDPLDAWTTRILTAAADKLGVRVVFPFQGPPYYPFQRWAQRADTVFPSPIGPLVHPKFGLWHAYRGALLAAERIELPRREASASPCDTCADQSCLSTCPVSAFSAQGYAVPQCVSHLKTAEGGPCVDLGCAARRACPVGGDYQYVPDQATFHQLHFMRNNGQLNDPEAGH